MAKKTADIFSEETHERVLARIRNRSPEDWERVLEEQPDALPEDWPSLVELPHSAPATLNGAAKKPRSSRP